VTEIIETDPKFRAFSITFLPTERKRELGGDCKLCLQADQLRIRTKKFEITGASTEKELTPLLEDVPAKKL
jgi:hypothetical protein